MAGVAVAVFMAGAIDSWSLEGWGLVSMPGPSVICLGALGLVGVSFSSSWGAHFVQHPLFPQFLGAHDFAAG